MIRKSHLIFIAIFSTSIYALDNKSIETVLKPYDIIKYTNNEKNVAYKSMLNQFVLKSDPKELSYNYFSFSNNSKIFNQKNIEFIIKHFSRSNYSFEQTPLLYNVNDDIQGEIMRISKEKNPIRKKIQTEQLFEKLPQYFDDEYLEQIHNINFYNSVNVDHLSEYNYENKTLRIVFNNDNNKLGVSLFCNKDVTIAYLYNNGTSFGDKYFYRINKNTPIIISIPEEIQKWFGRDSENRCYINKVFKDHEDAIKYYDVLKNPKSRFIIDFKINKEQDPSTFYYNAKASKFGLYLDNYGYAEEYDTKEGKTHKETVPNEIMNAVKNNNFFTYGDYFSIQDDFSNQLLYPISNFYLKFDETKLEAVALTQTMNATYSMEKIEHYYKLSLNKIHNLGNLNIPKTIYIRKLYDNYDAFINYTYSFESNIFPLDPKGVQKIK